MKFNRQNNDWFGQRWSQEHVPPKLCANVLFRFFDIPEEIKVVTITLSHDELENGYQYRFKDSMHMDILNRQDQWEYIVTHFEFDHWVRAFASEGWGNITYDEVDLP
jgi:hypothetical protein